jgi:hypothetical protein
MEKLRRRIREAERALKTLREILKETYSIIYMQFTKILFQGSI